MKKLTLQILALSLLISAGKPANADSFDTIKTNLAKSTCTCFEFVSILESDIFDVVDSTKGQACIASDGRYRVTLSDDQYLFDGRYLYSYSAENNQVVIETPDSNYVRSDRVAYMTRLDDYYRTVAVRPDRQYRLLRRSEVVGDIPDSMNVWIDSSRMTLELLTYFDVNDELNRIVITNQTVDTTCARDSFEPAFPDSVEEIKL